MIETFLSIASFSISVGGLVAVFVVKDNRKRAIVCGVVVAVITVTSGIALYSSYQHERQVDRIQQQMLELLSSEAFTFDDLYQNIYPPVSHKILREALYAGIEKDLVGYQPVRLQYNGKVISVKMFHARR